MRLLLLLSLIILAAGCKDPKTMLTPQDIQAAEGKNPNMPMQPAPMAAPGP